MPLAAFVIAIGLRRGNRAAPVVSENGERRHIAAPKVTYHCSICSMPTRPCACGHTRRRMLLAQLWCMALFLALGVSALAQASDRLPVGRAGDAVRAYFEAIKAADSVAIRAWLVRYEPEGDMTVRTGRQLALARRTGGFTVERVMRGTRDAVEAIVREQPTGDRIRFLLVLDANGVAVGTARHTRGRKWQRARPRNRNSRSAGSCAVVAPLDPRQNRS